MPASPTPGAVESSERPPLWRRLPAAVMPPAVWRAFALACLPLFLVYMVAVETDGVLTKAFSPWSAFVNTGRNLGPAFVLLIPVWAYTGWMERRGFGVARVLANHAGMAFVFAAAWHLALYLLIWATFGQKSAEKARSMWFLWQGMWGMMMYWAAAGGFTAYRAIERARVEAAASAQAQALLARTELDALRNKLNPHFLFNTLHSIIALTRRDAQAAERALLKFSELLRHVLDTERSGEDEVTLQQELDFTRDYLALEALRLGERLSVDWRVDERALAVVVPALSVQPLVENSIKHAFNPRSTPGRLVIAAATADDGVLRVRIEDDGPGQDETVVAASPGLGLRTVARRLALAYDGAAGLHVRSRPGAGFVVELVVPGVR